MGNPITGISMHSLEQDIVKYMILNKIVPDGYIDEFAKKFELKHMCVYIHNFNLMKK